MKTVVAELEFYVERNSQGFEVESVRATCTDCGHIVEAYGQGESSIRRCMARLREECPEAKTNYYVPDINEV
jgi:hypothetical protein